MEKLFIILLHGPMGSGKTTVSKQIFEDVVPCARVALPDIRRTISGDHRANGDVARTTMYDLTESYLKQNIPVVIDVVCKEKYIAEHKRLAEKYDAIFLPYFIYADVGKRWERVCSRTAEMMGTDVLPESKLDELKPIFAENQKFYDALDGDLGSSLDTSNISVEEVVTIIKESL